MTVSPMARHWALSEFLGRPPIACAEGHHIADGKSFEPTALRSVAIPIASCWSRPARSMARSQSQAPGCASRRWSTARCSTGSRTPGQRYTRTLSGSAGRRCGGTNCAATKRSGSGCSPSSRRDCHFTDTPCLSLLEHLTKLQGGPSKDSLAEAIGHLVSCEGLDPLFGRGVSQRLPAGVLQLCNLAGDQLELGG